MKTALSRVIVSSLVCAAAILPIASHAQTVQSLTPNPATGTNQYPVLLLPNPAQFINTSTWVNPAAQNAKQQTNLNANNNTWTFNFAPNDLNLNLDIGKSYTAVKQPGAGGADITITYTSVAGKNPPQPPNTAGTGANAFRWLQVVYTNRKQDLPAAYLPYTSAFGGGFVVMDDGLTFGNPWYGNLSGFANATATTFVDSPILNFDPGLIVEFQTFIAQDIVTVNAGKTSNAVTLYNGVLWGFQDVPEPGSVGLALALFGVTTPIVLYRKRRCATR